jgi:hypothetical protein
LKGGFKVENKNKNDFPGGKDDLNIKDHLNASFDMEKITVSEDLIARTLKKIQDSEVEGTTNAEIQKKKVIPMRRYVSAAAAVLLVVVVGTALVRVGTLNVGFGNSKQMNESSGSETAMPEEETSIYSAEGSLEQDLSAKQSKSDIGAKDNGQEEEKAALDTASAPEEEENGFALTQAPVFSVLFPVGDFADVKSFTLTRVSKEEKTLTLSVDVLESLYTLLDQYEMTEGIQAEDSKNQNIQDEKSQEEDASIDYKAEIVTGDGQKITLTFAEGLLVSQEADSLKADYFFDLKDWDDFIKEVDALYSSLE